jgi:hypothetical protein
VDLTYRSSKESEHRNLIKVLTLNTWSVAGLEAVGEGAFRVDLFRDWRG